jgi:uncharacterized protein
MDPDGFLDKNNIIAVIGVSPNPNKWGSRIFQTLKSRGFDVYPVNPKHKRIGDDICYPDLKSLPERPDVVITAVPPKVTENIAIECKKARIDKIWMQPGSDSEKVIEFCKRSNITAVYNACFVVDGLNGGQAARNVTFACKKITHEELVRCSFDLNKTEYNVLVFLLKRGREIMISGIADGMDLERTTVQKAMKRLLKKQLIKRFRRNLPKGGYIYLYNVSKRDEIKARMKEAVHGWYNRINREIDKL